MALGKGVHVIRTTTDIEISRPFYDHLNYKILFEKKEPTPLILWTDGRLNLLLQEDKESYIGFQYFDENLKKNLSELKKKVKLTFEGKISPNGPFQVNFSDPNGVKISIIEAEYNLALRPSPRGDSIIPYGNFGEFAIPTEDYTETEEFWKTLGFEVLFSNKDPYPWGILTDGLIVIGVHQSADFDRPALTYFKPEMIEVISELQEKGIIFHESEMSKIKDGNGITTSPEGQLFFFFIGDIK
jgi:hypothetical protein